MSRAKEEFVDAFVKESMKGLMKEFSLGPRDDTPEAKTEFEEQMARLKTSLQNIAEELYGHK